MKLKVIPLLIIFTLFSITFVSAVPPFINPGFSEGLTIQISQDNVLKVNQDYEFDFHIINISNGINLTSGIICNFHLYDNFGGHIFIGVDSTADEHGDYEFNVSGGNFSKTDNYYYYIQCHNSNLGGFSESIIYVNEAGIDPNIDNSGYLLALFGIIAFLFALGLTFDKEKWKLRSFFFMIALLLSIILLNFIRISMGISNNYSAMGSVILIVGIITLSFMFLYLFISYTIEVFQYFKNKKSMEWNISNPGR